MGVVALHALQLAAVVTSADGIDKPAGHAHAVVGVLLQQGFDGAPVVVARVVSDGGETVPSRDEITFFGGQIQSAVSRFQSELKVKSNQAQGWSDEENHRPSLQIKRRVCV